MPDPIEVKAAVAGPHRLDVFNAATGVRLGKINVRPREAAKMTDADKLRSVSMFCEMASAVHAPQTFTPHAGPTK